MIALPEAAKPGVPAKAGATVKVRATAKGYSGGPRDVGDVFDMPLNKDGSKPKGKWFVEVEQPKKAAQPAKPADDAELA
jgi:hypothetical protein